MDPSYELSCGEQDQISKVWGMMSREYQRRPIIWHLRSRDCVIKTISNEEYAGDSAWDLADRLLGPDHFESERSPMSWTTA